MRTRAPEKSATIYRTVEQEIQFSHWPVDATPKAKIFGIVQALRRQKGAELKVASEGCLLSPGRGRAKWNDWAPIKNVVSEGCLLSPGHGVALWKPSRNISMQITASSSTLWRKNGHIAERINFHYYFLGTKAKMVTTQLGSNGLGRNKMSSLFVNSPKSFLRKVVS